MFYSAPFLDELTMILLTLPVFFPVVTKLGFDPDMVWRDHRPRRRGGDDKPTGGHTMFIVKGIAPDIPIETHLQGYHPLLPSLVTLMIAPAHCFPRMALFLPRLMDWKGGR